jgi:ribosomal RNA-processing protein 1
MPTVKKPTKLEGQLISDPDLCAMEMDEFEKSLLQRSTKLSAKQKRKLAQMREEEKRLMEDDEESPKKRKLNSDDSDAENKEIDVNASGPLIKFVKGDNLSESKKVNSKMSKANVEWTEEDTNDDIVLSQESSSSEDESSEIAEAIVKKTVKKLKKRNSLPAMSSTHQNGVFSTHDEWSEPMKEGETEYFMPSRKQAVKKANEKTEAASQVVTPANEKKAKLVKNPFAVSISKP